MTSKKKLKKNEIDLADLLINILENKFKVFIIITISILISLFTYDDKNNNHQNLTTLFNAETKVKPISTFEEFKYETYNSYIIHNNAQNKFYAVNDYKNLSSLEGPYILREFYNFKNVDYSSFKIINRRYLLNLFIEKFNEEIILINGIKKFQLLKRENFESNREYENAILKLVSKIKLKIIENPNTEGDMPSIHITYQIENENKDLWYQLLKNFEENANLEIKNFIDETFDKIIRNQYKLTQYKIEDLEILKQSFSEDNKSFKELEDIKKYILEKKDVERLVKAFNTTPIKNSNDFYAAKISLETTKFNKLPSASKIELDKKTRLILWGVLGLIISIIYISLENTIKRRRRGLELIS